MKKMEIKTKIQSILNKQLNKVKLSAEEIKHIKNKTSKLINHLNSSIKGLKINASVFIGGSLAKNTLIRKKIQDIDLFIRFNDEKNIKKLEKIVRKTGHKYTVVHGSRDYIQIKKHNLLFEIIPVIKIKKPKDAQNVTDLSYFHVRYVLDKIRKKPKLADEIILTKSFCHAQGCYGAESYIRGFSGYAIELLIIYYGGFLRFADKIKNAEKKIIIDPEKHYKKSEIMHELNSSKLESPIIFIDPTFKERNALAALSRGTFRRFQKACKGFLKNPHSGFFKEKKIDVDNMKKKAGKKGLEFGIIKVKTNKQAGDIAGTRLLKFTKFLEREMSRYFTDIRIEFSYDNKKTAKIYFIGKKIKNKITAGPHITKIGNLLKFKRKYKKNVFIKNSVAFAKIKIDYSLRKAFNRFLNMHKHTLKDMGITTLRLSK